LVAEADRPAAVVDCAIAVATTTIGDGRGDLNGREAIYSSGLWEL